MTLFQMLPEEVRLELENILDEIERSNPRFGRNEPFVRIGAVSLWCVREIVRLRNLERARR